MKITQFSALARPLDINYRSNRNVLLIFLLVLILGTAYQWLVGLQFLDSLWWGVQAAFVVFLTWALGREVDPDINSTAMLSLAVALAAFYFFGEDFNWLLLIAWLMLMRIGSHICGQSVKLMDAVLVIGLATYLVWRGDYIIGFALSVAFFADYRLQPAHDRSLWYAIASFVLSIVALIFTSLEDYNFSYDYYWMGGVIGLGVLFAILTIPDYKRPRSTEDYRVQELSGSRMQAVQLILLVSLLLMYFLKGQTSVISLAPLWATLVSSILVRIYQVLTARSLA